MRMRIILIDCISNIVYVKVWGDVFLRDASLALFLEYLIRVPPY